MHFQSTIKVLQKKTAQANSSLILLYSHHYNPLENRGQTVVGLITQYMMEVLSST